MFGKAIQTLRIYDFNTKKDIIFPSTGREEISGLHESCCSHEEANACKLFDHIDARRLSISAVPARLAGTVISVKITFYDDSTIETMPVSQGSFALLNPLTYPGNARVNGETIIALYSEMKAQNTIMSMPSMFTEIEAEFLTTGKQVGGFRADVLGRRYRNLRDIYATGSGESYVTHSMGSPIWLDWDTFPKANVVSSIALLQQVQIFNMELMKVTKLNFPCHFPFGKEDFIFFFPK